MKDIGIWYRTNFVNKMSDAALTRTDSELGGGWWRNRVGGEGAGGLEGIGMSEDNRMASCHFTVDIETGATTLTRY